MMGLLKQASFCVTRKSGTWMFPKTHLRFFEFKIGASSVKAPPHPTKAEDVRIRVFVSVFEVTLWMI